MNLHLRNLLSRIRPYPVEDRLNGIPMAYGHPDYGPPTCPLCDKVGPLYRRGEAGLICNECWQEGR